MPRARANVTALLKLAADLGLGAEELEKTLEAALTKASIAGLATWRELMPVFTGEGVNSILSKGVSKVQGTAGGVVYTDLLFSTTPQVIIADQGRRRGATPPPLGPIFRWVQLKARRGGFDLSWTDHEGDAAVLIAAMKIQQAIGARGLPAGRQAAKAVAIATTVLEQELAQAATDFSRRAGT